MNTTTTNHNKYLLAMIALIVVPISGLAIDIYVPSLPDVSEYFGVNKAYAQLSITTYMCGLGISQLFSGSISDSFGRRIPYYVGMIVFILTSFLIPLCTDILQLLVLRFVQGSAVALTVVPMRAVISDLFTGRELKRWMNFMTMAWSIGPIIAPAIGGYLQHYFGWQACFYFLTIYSAVVFLLSFFILKETSVHFHPLHLGDILNRYRRILFHKSFAVGLISNGLMYSMIILFSVVGPFLVQRVLHFTAIQFGHISLLMGLAWFLGSLTNSWLIDIPLAKKAQICYWTMFVILLIMLIISILIPLNIYNIVLPMFAVLWIGGIVFPNHFTRSLNYFANTAASANALFSAFVFIIAGITSAFGTLLRSTSETPLAIADMILVIGLLLLFFWDKTNIENDDKK